MHSATHRPWLDRLVLGVVVLAAWEAVSRLMGAYWISSPLLVVSRLGAMAANGDLWFHGRFTLGEALGGFLLKFFPWPPLLSISIEYTITDYVDILTPKCIDKRRIIIAFNSLPPGKHCRKILLKCTTENKLCTCLELDMNMAF